MNKTIKDQMVSLNIQKKALAGFLALILCLSLWAVPAKALVELGLVMPPISLPDTSGREQDLVKLTKGKVALFVYWSISCPDCRREMPHILNLAQKLTGNPFVVLLVNADGPAMAQAAQAYADSYHLPGPILMDAGPKDSQPFGEAFDCIATPTVLVLDKTGKLTHAQEVKVDMPKLTAAVGAAF